MVQSVFSVVAFRPEHAAAWRSLNEGWITECGFVLESKDHKVLDDPFGQIIDRDGHIFIVETAQGDAVGCCALMHMDDGGLELGKMTVRPDMRGHGLSRLLMQACVDRATEAGATRLYLETNSALTPAITLYEAFGFVNLPVTQGAYARVDVIMEKRLK